MTIELLSWIKNLSFLLEIELDYEAFQYSGTHQISLWNPLLVTLEIAFDISKLKFVLVLVLQLVLGAHHTKDLLTTKV